MSSYASDRYFSAKKWVSQKIEEGNSWNDVAHLCTDPDSELKEFDWLQSEEMIIPLDMEFDEWSEFVHFIQKDYVPVTEVVGIPGGNSNKLPVPSYDTSSWAGYKRYLLGEYSGGEAKLSDKAVSSLESNCHWILNHMERDTRSHDPVKGLVMGSVQSGKTANMIGLVTMAADYDWNIFIILSGTIETLRKQTRNRFNDDLSHSGGAIKWHIMDYTNNSMYMKDINSNKQYLAEDLNLNSFYDGKSEGTWVNRYVFVCLKNSKRLRNLIEWLHSSPARAARMRLLVIDDEADQASINTAKMTGVQDEEELERTAVNQLIIDLVKGCDSEGNVSKIRFQAMNYISYTATPYANVLNEAYKESLYPNNFICSLPESDEHFGPKAMWGSKNDENYSGINIIRTIPEEELKELKFLHKGITSTLPEEFRKSVAWFLCAASVLRNRGYKKPISMLIHTTSIQNGHFEEYEALRSWLVKGSSTGEILTLCENVYEEEKDQFRLSDLKEGYPQYERLDDVDDNFPEFGEIKDDISELLKDIVNIELGEDKKLIYHENGIHLCVDNCKANRIAEEGTYLRIVYPSSQTLADMNKAPVFIVMGGNTLSRGLTLEGLVCTYFARNVNQADTLMQMARWFGYRFGYELLQRIWMPKQVQEKFELIEEIDETLKQEIEDFMDKAKSPSQYGPRVMSSSKIARFLLTSKNKSQNMIPCDMDFSGDSYEVTQFENISEDLKQNIKITEEFLSGIGVTTKSEAIETAFVWRGVDSTYIISEFIDKYKIFDCSPLHTDIPLFKDWMIQMNQDGHFLKWNVALAGDKRTDNRWVVSGADVGKIERSRKVKSEYIDIGSLRSGRDVLSDILVSKLSEEKRKKFEERKKNGKNLIGLRYDVGLSDIPLLLLYRIDKDKGQESKYRTKIGTDEDIIGFSIVIAGQEISSNYVKSVKVRMPD